jgi:hypothetical protein
MKVGFRCAVSTPPFPDCPNTDNRACATERSDISLLYNETLDLVSVQVIQQWSLLSIHAASVSI